MACPAPAEGIPGRGEGLFPQEASSVEATVLDVGLLSWATCGLEERGTGA